MSVTLIPEPCPIPTELTVEGCKDAARMALAPTPLTGLGRIVQLDAVIKNVCPGRQIAVSILLSEVDDQGVEHPRGVKHLLIPGQTGTACQDLTLRCIPFSVPEALDVAGAADSLCNARKFHARVIANYVDTDFACCEAAAEPL